MINNKNCVSCQQPMNGGVYRKPNQCPHCLTLQDHAKSADNKPLSAVAKIASAPAESVHAETAPRVPIAVEAVPHTAKVIAFDRHLVEVEEVEAEYGEYDADVAESVAFEAAPRAPLLDEVVLDEAVQEEAVVSNALIADEGAVVASTAPSPEEETAAPAADSDRRPRHFENLEVKPDLNESLDIALNIDAEDKRADAEHAFSVDTSSFLSMEHAVVALARETHLRVSGDSAVRAKVAPSAVAPVLSEPLPAAVAVKPAAPKPALTETQSDNSDYEKVVLTTESAQGMPIEKHIDLVTAECVVGMDRVKHDMNKTREFSRKEYGASPSVLKDARKTVLDEIKKEAFIRGGDTVVNVQLAYKEISRGDAPMMMVIATGTAVKAKAKQAVGA